MLKATVRVNEDFVSQIAKIFHDNPTSEAMAIEFSNRKRDRHTVDLYRFKLGLISYGVKVDEQKYAETWEKMQRLDLGYVVQGRHGNPDRFVLRYSLIDIGRAAIDASSVHEIRRVQAIDDYANGEGQALKKIETAEAPKPEAKPEPKVDQRKGKITDPERLARMRANLAKARAARKFEKKGGKNGGNKKAEPRRATRSATPKREVRDNVIVLYSNSTFDLPFKLPTSFNQEQADNMARFIKNLPETLKKLG